ncbi:hypothetical protein Tco_1104108 [Tanacetum coccineum]
MKGGLKWSASAILLGGQILDEFWTLWINEFLKGICKRIIREVFVKLLLDSFGKLSIRPKLSSARPKLSTDSTKIESMKLEAMMESPEQTASGKDFSNPLMADSLPKTIWFSIPSKHSKELASPKQTAFALAIPEQTTTGKEISNPFMAGSLPKTTKPTYLV